jgi:hypothetical protein
MKRHKERKLLSQLTKDVEDTTRKLTSRIAFYNDMIALHSNSIWENQKKWYSEKKQKVRQNKTTAQNTFMAKKEKCDIIRKQRP